MAVIPASTPVNLRLLSCMKASAAIKRPIPANEIISFNPAALMIHPPLKFNHYNLYYSIKCKFTIKIARSHKFRDEGGQGWLHPG